jgi:hypothetical protein
MNQCRECGNGELKVLGTGGFGDVVEVECQNPNCGEIYDVEPDGLGMGGEEWILAKSIDEQNKQEKEFTAAELAEINDTLRKSLCNVPCRGVVGRLMASARVAELPRAEFEYLLAEVIKFNQFNEDNDPHAEHDFGRIELFGHTWFWKFSYYDQNLIYFGHTVHVLMIMHSSEL